MNPKEISPGVFRVSQKYYHFVIPVVGKTEKKEYNADSYLDDCTYWATHSVNYTVVFTEE